MRTVTWTIGAALALVAGGLLSGCGAADKKDDGAAGSTGSGTGGSAGASAGAAGAAGAGAGAGGSTAGSGGAAAGAGGASAGSGGASAGSGGSTAGSGGKGTAGSGGATGGSGGATGGSGGATGGSGGAASGAWTAIKLIDESDAGSPIEHSQYDWVTALLFDSAGNGAVGTAFQGKSNFGGTLTQISGNKATKILLNGTKQWLDKDGDVTFRAFHKGKNGVVVQTDRIGLVYLSTDGKTFTRTPSGTGFENLANATYGWFEDGAGGYFTADNLGNVYHATEAPSATTDWKTVTPKTTDCAPPLSEQTGSPGYSWRRFAVSEDGKTIMYPLAEKHGVCVSGDGGATWGEKLLPTPPKGADTPRGIVVTSAKTAVLYSSGQGTGTPAYVYTTGDGGQTWTASSLPSEATDPNKYVDFQDASFEPKGVVGYIVGRKSGDSSAPPPMLYKSIDGGKTWKDITVASFGGSKDVPIDSASFLGAVQAPDENNVWIGGHDGTVLHHDKGGISN